MQFTRRNFIQLVVGGVVGAHLTPAPWKLIDDVSIWTQNWPWVPRVARYPDIEFERTVCNLCNGGCGVDVRLVNDENTVKAEGAPAAPVNQGGICPLGAAGPQYQYSISRFHSPVKRLGARGSGAWSRMTWSQAYDEVGGRLKELRDQGLAHTVVMITGRKNTLGLSLAQRFMEAYGSPNLIQMPGLDDSRRVAERSQFGWEDSIGYDLENSDYVLSFGCRIIEGWGSPVRSIRAYSDWRAGGGTKLVQIESRSSITASKADRWVAPAPGTEAALALGVAAVMIEKGLYDKAFVADNTYGFEQFKKLVLREYSPAKTAEITGVAVSTIVSLAEEFGASGKGVALGGRGKGDMPTPVYELMAVMALNALKGAINRPGGVIIRKDLPLAQWPEPELDAAAEEGLAAPRLDLAGTERYPLAESLLHNFAASVEKGRFYPVNMLIIDRANPAWFGASPAEFRSALGRIPMVVSLSGVADDTSFEADVVLPEASNYEGPADVVNPPTLPYPLFGYGEGVVRDRSFDAEPIGDVFIGLAKAVGGSVKKSMPFRNHKDMLKESAAGLFEAGRGKIADDEGAAPGLEFGRWDDHQEFDSDRRFMRALRKGVFWYDPSFEYGRLEGAFQTPSEKFEFLSQYLQSELYDFVVSRGVEAALAEMGVSKDVGQLFLPHYEPGRNGGSHMFPLTLEPVEQLRLVNSSVGSAPYLVKSLETTTLDQGDYMVVEINPKTARGLHLSEGDKVWLKTPKGRREVLVHLYEGARPGVVYAPLGLGHNGYDLYLRGKGANTMDIVEASADPLSGHALWWSTPANLTKV